MKKLIVVGVLAVVFFGGLVGVVQADLTDGLVAYYPFSGNADDESGNGYHGVVTGATLTTDRFGNANSAYNFDGIDDLVDIGEVGDNFSNITMTLWFKKLSDSSGGIISKFGSGTNYSYRIITNSSSERGLRVSVFTNSDEGIDYLPMIELDIWYFIACTYDGEKIKLFINGNLYSEETQTGTIYNSTVSTYIGWYERMNYYFHGCIDDIRIYNRALSESEVQMLSYEGKSCEECYQAGRQACIDDPASCGISVDSPYRPPFSGELAESIQSYLVLTKNSVPFYLSPGSYVQAFGSDNTNTVNVEKYARLQCQNFIGKNEINIEEASSEFTVYRSGATVYLNSTSGTRVEIAATETPQILRFADGSLELAIITENVMLGSQVVDETETEIESAVDNNDTSESLF